MGVNHAANLSGTAGDVSTMFFGSVSGGLSAELSGGNFWQGAATGLAVSALNHVAHRVEAGNLVKKTIKNSDYEPTAVEKAIWKALPWKVKLKYALISKFTKQGRHIYGPDAISISKKVEGGAIVGGEAGAGAIAITRGNSAGIYFFGDYGGGLSSVSISTGLGAGEFFYTGSLDSMSINTFLGYRTSISLSVDIGFSAGIGVIYSEYKGNKVYSLTGFVGIGASMTIFDFNLNYGQTK